MYKYVQAKKKVLYIWEKRIKAIGMGQSVDKMLQTTKKEYVIIAKKYDEIVVRLGELAPYLSRDFKIGHTIEALVVENKIKVGRTTVYAALRLYPKLKKEEMFLLNE